MLDLNEKIELAINHDESARNDIYKVIEPVIKVACNKFYRNKNDVEDAFQNISIKIFDSLHKYDKVKCGKFEAWVWAISKNTCIDYLRKEKIKYLDWEFDSDYFFKEDNKTDDYEYLNSLIDKLPKDQKKAIKLFYFENNPHESIASKFGFSVNGSKILLYRAKNNLKEQLNNNN
jgi:RNA polymerase sigma-70 factor (ECF subfamily)